MNSQYTQKPLRVRLPRPKNGLIRLSPLPSQHPSSPHSARHFRPVSPYSPQHAGVVNPYSPQHARMTTSYSPQHARMTTSYSSQSSPRPSPRYARPASPYSPQPSPQPSPRPIPQHARLVSSRKIGTSTPFKLKTTPCASLYGTPERYPFLKMSSMGVSLRRECIPHVGMWNGYSQILEKINQCCMLIDTVMDRYVSSGHETKESTSCVSINGHEVSAAIHAVIFARYRMGDFVYVMRDGTLYIRLLTMVKAALMNTGLTKKSANVVYRVISRYVYEHVKSHVD
jgi:hypothetical protein